jgi:hypothetical protein
MVKTSASNAFDVSIFVFFRFISACAYSAERDRVILCDNGYRGTICILGTQNEGRKGVLSLKIAIFETLPGFGGGNIYQKYVADGLKLSHEVRVFRVKGHQLLGTRLGKAWHAARYFRCYPQIDLWISTFLPTIALNFCRPKGKVISLFYHLDDVDYPNTLISYLLRYLYLRQAKRSNGVVVISRYWQSFMERLKVNITDLIYWGFDISKFKLNTNQVEIVTKKKGLSKLFRC